VTLGVSPARSPLEPTPGAPGSLPERVLVRGYGGLEPPERRSEPCACGGTIDATYRPAPEAVADHVATRVHLAWRAAREAG
jgi:hypothetical protein